MRQRWRQRNEQGFAAFLVAALMASGVFLGLAAFGVDTARWYVEIQRVQRAADAAALAGVPYLPNDLVNATAKAKEVSKRNGYDDAAANVQVTVTKGTLASQLKVTVSTTIENQFGQMIGVSSANITRSAVADFKGSAPMGSPCNTFGNEPTPGTPAVPPATVPPTPPALPADTALPPLGQRFPNCESRPQFWATVEGPQTDKANGDRYGNIRCLSSSTYQCSGGVNSEYRPDGYFWVIRVEPTAVNQPIKLQLYDPAYVSTGQTCGSLPNSGDISSNNMNPYVTTDAKTRYSKSSTSPSSTGAPFCNGDFLHGTAMTTSFVVREQHDSLDPMQGAVISGCTKQYKGTTTTPSNNSLRASNGSYNEHLARVFHNWTPLCTFTPTRSGDYYLQVRTNVTAAGTAEPNTNSRPQIIYSGNAAAAAATGNTDVGGGVNSFAIRAVTNPGLETQVAVSGYDRMPIFANAPSAESEFNLIRVLPGAAGQYITFSFFDVADAEDQAGTVTVIRPDDATGSILTTPFPGGGCIASGGQAGAQTIYPTCSAPIHESYNNGKLETLSIPIPSDYDCNYASLGGCWYKVEVSLPGGAVNDITTWDATIEGDPVRLIE